MNKQKFRRSVKKSKVKQFLKLMECLDYVQRVESSNDHIVKGKFKPKDKPSNLNGLLPDSPNACN
jgi:hypothetical protein